MKTTNPELKNAIIDIIHFDNGVTKEGKRVERDRYDKDIFRAVCSLRDKISAQMRLGVRLSSDESPADINAVEWVAPKEVKEGYSVLFTRHTDEELEFSEREIAALKSCFKYREEFPKCSLATLDEFENMISYSEEC